MYRLLIADDEPIERMAARKMIQENYKDQMEIFEAANGREAIEVYEKHKCQIILLDIEMPGISGLEAAEKIREQDKACSIIFLTAFDYFTYAKKAITVKALDYLLKPSTDEEMIAVIDEAVRLADERQQMQQPSKPEDHIIDNEKIEQVHTSVIKELIQNFIRAHYMEDVSLQEAAQTLNYSDAYFCKLFKQYFHKGFIAYLSEYRIEKAKQLLMDVTINVKEISDQVGYHDPNYFAKVFKRVEGVTPSEYRTIILEEKMNIPDEMQ